MLKYLHVKVVFSEIPDEISLAIAISGCTLKCKGCHSKELWDDVGILLTDTELDRLLRQNKGITCFCFFGGEHDLNTLYSLFLHLYGKVEVAWYSGLDELPHDGERLLRHLNYIKLGHYDESKGGLDSPTTNQRLYHVIHNAGNDSDNIVLEDITYKLLKNKTNNENKSKDIGED